MKVLNIYEFYYTFYSWELYSIIYQLFWSTKLILLPFMFIVFKMIMQQVEDTNQENPSFNKSITAFIVATLVFIFGAVPAVELKVSDSTVHFLSCDIQKEVHEIAPMESTLTSESIKIPLVPYFLYSLGSGINSAIGTNLTCMQSVVSGLENITTSDLDLSNDPPLNAAYNAYINQCHHQSQNFVNNFLNAMSLDKAKKIHEYYRPWNSVPLGSFFGYSNDKAGVVNGFKAHLMANNNFLTEVVYSDDPVAAIQKIGSDRRQYRLYDESIRAESNDVLDINNNLVSTTGNLTHPVWVLSNAEKDWINTNLPLVMRLKKSEVDYLLGSSAGKVGFIDNLLETSSLCNVTADTESVGDDPVSCFKCNMLSKTVLDQVARQVAIQQVEKQIRNNLNPSNNSHPIIVRPSRATDFNKLLAAVGISGDNKSQKADIDRILLKNKLGFVYNDNIKLTETGALYPPEAVVQLAEKLLRDYPDEAGYLSATQTSNNSVLNPETREGFMSSEVAGMYLASTFLSKGDTIVNSLNKWISIQLTSALMLQVLPIVLMLYTIFWLPYMVLSMYDAKGLLKGSAFFLVIRLTPLFVIIVTSSASELANILVYNTADKFLIEMAASIIAIGMPIILLTFMAASFGSSISHSIAGAAATGGAAFGAISGKGASQTVGQIKDAITKKFSKGGGGGQTGSKPPAGGGGGQQGKP